MEQEKHRKKKGAARKAFALFLALVLTLLPCIAWVPGGVLAGEAGFTVEKLESEHMLTDVNFRFFGLQMGSGIYYWMKSDGSPLFCVQKQAQLTYGLEADEKAEPVGECTYFTREQYEMASIILQCCGLKKEEAGTLEPGAYLAGQAAVWGIQSSRYTGTDQLKEEMETLYGHVKDWHGLTSGEIVAQAREMMDRICQALEDYYGDASPYIPSFASKYEEKAPVHGAKWQEDGSCEATFSLGDKDGAVKEFTYRLPEGWSMRWDGDQVTFRCQDPEPGVVSVAGTAPKDSQLSSAMPVGLIYIVGITKYSFLQHLASCVEITMPWSCYFKISVPEKPEEGSWYLPETEYYRHQEDFKALYGAGLEKTDGDTGEALPGVGFQVLEYFDDSQLEGTVLDEGQFSVWNGWKVFCPEEITDASGQISHTDQKEYHFETTYCTGHPDPEIIYEGDSEEFRNLLEEEAWQAWEEEVQACSQICRWHAVDGSGEEKARQERDLAYDQFIRLVYGYTFRETEPLEGYLPLEEDPQGKEIGKIFCESVQAGGRYWEDETWGQAQVLPGHSANPVRRVMAASKSNAEKESEGNPAVAQETVPPEEAGADWNIRTGARRQILRSGSDEVKILPPGAGGEEQYLPFSDEAKKKRKTRQTAPVWLTGSIEPLDQENRDGVDYGAFYLFQVENHKPEIPEETTPEETTPEETTPEETTPEETTPEETPPEETTPEETIPEETTPEETTPEETPPEETPPEETTPEETTPEETTPEETTPEETTLGETTPGETTPEETPPEETTAKETPPAETVPKETPSEETPPEETLPEETTPEETPPEETAPVPEESTPRETPAARPSGSGGRGGGGSPSLPLPSAEPVIPSAQPSEPILPERVPQGGWIGARYTPPVMLDENGVPLAVREGRSFRLPKTGDQGKDYRLLAGIAAVSGILGLCWFWKGKKGRKGNRKCRGILFWLLLSAFLSVPAPLKAQAEENTQTEGRLQAEAGTQAEPGDLAVYIPAEEGEEFTPDQHYSDESGKEYQLVSCRLAEQEQPEREEAARKIYTFQGLEGQAQIPEEITFPFREAEGDFGGSGKLKQTQVLEVSQYWEDGFSVPVTFYGYGSDYYDFQEVQVPKNGELEYLLEHGQLILEEVGCSGEQYQIDGITWDGESYMEEGISCRNALAYGKKLLADYVVAYEGVLEYPKTREMVWEVIYRPVNESLAESDPVLEAETKSTQVIEGTVPKKEPPAREQKSMEAVWKIFRTLAVYSVSLAAFIPVLVYLVLLFRKKKQTLPGR